MIQMAYLSFATRALKMDADGEIEKILSEAEDHNARNDITGQLIYRAGVFVQFLEGEKSKVQRLMGAIAMDRNRHENIKFLFSQDGQEERIFPNWSMAYKKLDDEALDLVNSIVPWQNILTASQKGEVVPAEKIIEIFETLKE